MPDAVFEVHTEKVRVFFVELQEGLRSTKALMNEIGGRLMQSIKDRTADGIDAEGNQFKDYSKEHARIRELVGLQTEHVDLFFGGSMLGSMTYESDRTSTKLFFLNTPHVEHVVVPGHKKKKSGTVTNAELAYYNDEVRPFFSISAEEQEMILGMVDDYVDLIIKGGSRGKG